MIYDLSKPTNRQRFDKRCKVLTEQGKSVELIDKTIRTMPQHRYLHLIITWFAIEHGYSVDFVKRYYYKVLCNADLFVTETACKFTGEVLTELKSVNDLPVPEMTLSIDRFRTWSAQNGTYLPTPDEREFLQEIEYEAGKLKEHL